MRDIPGFEGHYAVSEDGKIVNLLTGNTLKHKASGDDGYQKVTLTENGKRVRKLVHRLIAMAYIPNPEHKVWVEHINGNLQDNRLSNLRWSTREERSKHRPYHENGVNAAAIARGKAVIMCDAKTDIPIRTFKSSSVAARELFDGDTSKNSLINRCANGKVAQAYGFCWKWAEVSQ